MFPGPRGRSEVTTPTFVIFADPGFLRGFPSSVLAARHRSREGLLFGDLSLSASARTRRLDLIGWPGPSTAEFVPRSFAIASYARSGYGVVVDHSRLSRKEERDRVALLVHHARDTAFAADARTELSADTARAYLLQTCVQPFCLFVGLFVCVCACVCLCVRERLVRQAR